MYKPGTILERKEPLGTEDEPNAYDRVRVINASPISHPGFAEWEGVGASGVIIQPAGAVYGANLDKPFGELQRLYDVVETPSDQINASPTIQVIDRTSSASGPTPEEAFARHAERELAIQ